MAENEIEQVRVGIVGAGPIGLELAVALHRLGVSYRVFESQQIGHTFTWWPRSTSFFSTTERIEIAGVPIQKTNQERTTGEEYLAYLRAVVEQFDLAVNTYEPVTGIQPDGEGGFRLHSHSLRGPRVTACQNVVLSIGDMDYPNLLGIPGEELPHVSHYFTDPHMYFRKRLLVVGGKNSAVEAALRCWRAGSQVSISYRRAEFDSQAVKHWLLPDLKTQIENGNIGFYPETVPVEIRPGSVLLRHLQTGAIEEIQTDFVLLSTGFRADSTLFEKAGVHLAGEDRAPVVNPETMETNVRGIFVAGTAAAGSQSKYTLFIENTHVHVSKIVRAITGQWPEPVGTVPGRRYELPFEDIQSN